MYKNLNVSGTVLNIKLHIIQHNLSIYPSRKLHWVPHGHVDGGDGVNE